MPYPQINDTSGYPEMPSTGYPHVGVQSRTIEDFERDNLDPYQGDLSDYQTQSFHVLEGSVTLERDTSSAPSSIWSLYGDGLDYYPQPGDRWEVSLQSVEQSSVAGYCWGKSTDSRYGHYEVRLDDPDSFVSLLRVNPDGSEDTLDEFGYFVSEGIHVCDTTWGADGDITVVVFDRSSDVQRGTLSATDTTFTGRGIQWRGANQIRADGWFKTGIA